jgi:hypothetical protein
LPSVSGLNVEIYLDQDNYMLQKLSKNAGKRRCKVNSLKLGPQKTFWAKKRACHLFIKAQAISEIQEHNF